MTYVSDATRALIGVESATVISEPVSADAVRRFVQATSEEDPVYWDEAVAVRRYGGPVAPPLYPMHAFRRKAGTPDPLDRIATDPDWDGLSIDSAGALPPVNISLKRALNGGSTVQIHALARIGEPVLRTSVYEGFDEKEGRSGPLVVVRTRSDYRTPSGQLLISVQSSSVRR
jgi:N-terminal half of MaoC dehydratase